MNPAAEPTDKPSPVPLYLGEFQQLIRDMYYSKDIARGIDGTFRWLMAEVGALASALRNGTREDRFDGGDAAEVRHGLPRLRAAGVHLRRRGEAVGRAKPKLNLGP